MPEFFGLGGVDVATLGLRVDAREVENATEALSDLQSKGAEVEQQTERVTATSRRMTQGMATTARALENVAVNAGGLNARLVRTLTLIGSMTLSATTVIGVLAGLAAIAAAFRQIGKDAREARQESARLFDESFERLGRLAEGDPLRADVGRITQRLLEVQAELAQIPVTPFGQAGRDRRRLEAERDDLQRRRDAGFRALVSGQVSGLISEREFGDPFIGRIGSPSVGARGVSAIGGGDLDDARHAQRQAFFNSEAFLALAEEQQRIIEETIDREIELANVRRRANESLILSLENVGRAYGGVIDQIFALTAATLRLFGQGRLPGFEGAGFNSGNVVTDIRKSLSGVSTGDLARGLGTSALTGIGFGASTGSALYGGIGGGVAGFAAAGPAGAVVGAVSGIVSGLIEQGARARAAARAWDAAFTEFDRLFDDPGTDLEQNLQLIEDRFQALMDGLEDQLSPGTLLETEKALKRLQQARKENIQQAHDQADAEERLFTSRFYAENAPQGFNAPQYWYGNFGEPRNNRRIDFGAVGVPDPSSSVIVEGDVVITVDGAASPEDTAREVWRQIGRHATRGGASPFSPASR